MKISTSMSLTKVKQNPLSLRIQRLFNSQPGRNGFFFGNSYEEIINRNLSALGTNLFNGNSLTLTPETEQSTNIAGVIGKTYVVYCSNTDVRWNFGPGWITLVHGWNTVVSNGTGGRYRNFSTTSSVTFVPDVREIDCTKCSLFDDSIGTLPVVNVLQSVRGRGLLLDRSKGSIFGPELITNGDFSNGTTGWTVNGAGATLTVSGGVATVTNGTAEATLRLPSIAAGKWYRVEANITAQSGSTTTYFVPPGGGLPVNIPRIGVGVLQGCFYSGSGGVPSFNVGTGNTGNSFSIDNISMKEVPGNHLMQPTVAARGEFSRRYNLLMYTEEFSNVIWTKNNGLTVVATGLFAPGGYPVSKLIAPIGAGLDRDIRAGSIDLAVGSSTRFSVLLKPAGLTAVSIVALGRTPTASETKTSVDLITGNQQNTVGNGPVVVTMIEDGWVKIEQDRLPVAGSTQFEVRVCLADSLAAGTTSTGDGIVGVYIAAPDFRRLVDSIPSIPSYQRITTATNYDVANFPVYHREQTDDSGSVKQLNPAGATKAVALWAGQKMSESAYPTILESSSNWSTTNGSITLSGGNSSGYSFGSRGAASSPVNVGGFLSPSRSVVLGVADINTDSVSININGVQVGSSALDQGVGSYTTQDVFFGARAGNSNFANTRTFAPPMLMFMQSSDPGLSPSELIRLQKLYAKSVGISLP